MFFSQSLECDIFVLEEVVDEFPNAISTKLQMRQKFHLEANVTGDKNNMKIRRRSSLSNNL